MQMILLRSRPPFKRGLIATHSSKVTIVQPILHLFRLLDPDPRGLLRMRRRTPVARAAQRQPRSLRRRPVVIILRPARADEEDVADFNVAALRGRGDVDALCFAAGAEVRQRNGV